MHTKLTKADKYAEKFIEDTLKAKSEFPAMKIIMWY